MTSPTALIARPRAAVLLGGAGVALLVAQGLLPAFPSNTEDQVAVASAHRAAEVGSAAAFVVAGVLLVLGVTVLNGLALQRGRTLTRIGLVVTAIGALWPVAGRAAFNAMLVALTGIDDRSTGVAAMRAISNSGAFGVILPTLLAFALGPVLLTLGLHRAGVLPVWPAALWFAGVLVVNATEDSSRLAASLGMLLVAGALTWIGRGTAAAAATG